MTVVPERDAWKALAALVIGFFMILVDQTIVAVATEAFVTQLGATTNQVIWVTSAYLLAYVVPLLFTGRLGDQIGPRTVSIAGLVVFTGASLWCGLAPDIENLIVARVFQGIGAALIGMVLARIFVRPQAFAGLLGSRAGTDYIILLDDSFSMGLAETGSRAGDQDTSVFDQALTAVERLVGCLREECPSDALTIAATSQPDQAIVAETNLGRLDPVDQRLPLGEVGGAGLGHEVVDAGAGEVAGEVLGEAAAHGADAVVGGDAEPGAHHGVEAAGRSPGDGTVPALVVAHLAVGMAAARSRWDRRLLRHRSHPSRRALRRRARRSGTGLP